MEKYVFYVKGKDTRILPKKQLSEENIKLLKQEGFEKYYLEVEVNSQKGAVAKLNKHNNENMQSLGNFSGNILFSSIIGVLIFVIVLCTL